MASTSIIVLVLSLWAINKKKCVIISRAFGPPAHTLQHVSCFAHTAVSGLAWYSFDLDAVSAFISSHLDLAPGDHVYMKGLAGYNIGEDNCMYMLKCIYSLVQAPRQYYMLCRALYQKAGLKQLQTDECMFIRDVYNIIGQQELTNKDLLINGKSLNTVETSGMWCLTKCTSTSCAVIRWLL
jgi:hypothetical protein